MAQTLPRPKHEELLAAAVRLFGARGYHATSMQDLAESVGVQRGSLYHYIDAKEDLLWEIMERAMTSLRAAVEGATARRGTAAERLRRAVEAHLRAAAAIPDELTILHVELKSLSGRRRSAMVALRDAYEQLFRGVVEDGVAAGEFRGVDAKAVSFAILGACNWFTQWYDPRGPMSHGRFAEIFAHLFLRGLDRRSAPDGPGERRP